MKKLSLRASSIGGLGVFANEHIACGEVVMLWCMNCYITSEQAYNDEQKAGNILMQKTGCRFIDGIFLYTDDTPRIENYVNHNFTPNMLYHAGICFALKDIQHDEELTVDYRYILAKNDYGAFVDTNTGTLVDGLDSITCIIETSEQLAALYKKIKLFT
jgi:SET domain-containing protein